MSNIEENYHDGQHRGRPAEMLADAVEAVALDEFFGSVGLDLTAMLVGEES